MNEISTKKIVTDSVNYDEEKMKKLFREIARRLHTERIRQDYSTAQLALRADINAATIYRIERNSGEVSLRGLIKLSIALNRPLGYFVPILIMKITLKNGLLLKQIFIIIHIIMLL